MKKKILVACLCVALAVLTVAGTTLAYLTSQDEVKNTFTVGNVAITLDEAKVNTDGSLVYKENTTTPVDRVDNNSYKLMPGHKYIKDPTVHVDANSEDCWLFVKVENGLASYEATSSAAEGGYKTIADQIKANGWTELTGVTGVYYRAYPDTTNANQQNFVVFSEFQMSDTANADATKWAALKDATIVVTAYAVQADGFDTASAAWTATFGKPASGN